MSEENILVLALSRDQHYLFAPLYGTPGWEIIETTEWNRDKVKEVSPDILLTPTCDSFESAACIDEASRLGVPSLLVIDGAIEWRHQWENPKFGAGGGIPRHIPATTDKIACIGWSNARTLETWGNIGKCEIVGLPRFDHYLNQPVQLQAHEGPKRLLIMTNNSPGYLEADTRRIKQSLVDVKNYLAGQSVWEPIWRVRGGLEIELDLVDELPELRGQPLRNALAAADAVLTTPSTVSLEAMLVGLPTAHLDYTNSPPYVPTAWMITAQEQIGPIAQGLHEGSIKRMTFQDEVLHNCLECRSPATPRLVALVERMVQIGRVARESGSKIEFPDRILPQELDGHSVPSKHFDLGKLYPDHPVFTNANLNELQLQLVHSQQETASLKHKVERRSLSFAILKFLRILHSRLPFSL